MRPKDEAKQQAIFEATVKLVNRQGFVASSVSKIAGDAGVSPATIYVYYHNKEDLLVSTYTTIKRDLSRAILDGFDESLPVRDVFKGAWVRLFDYISAHREQVQFAEQFANSPYSDRVNRAEIEGFFEPLSRVLFRGIDQKIIKNVHHDILRAFLFSPVMVLTNPRLCKDFTPTREAMDIAFDLAWDAVKY